MIHRSIALEDIRTNSTALEQRALWLYFSVNSEPGVSKVIVLFHVIADTDDAL
jgi:hypothetical protein